VADHIRRSDPLAFEVLTTSRFGAVPGGRVHLTAEHPVIGLITTDFSQMPTTIRRAPFSLRRADERVLQGAQAIRRIGQRSSYEISMRLARGRLLFDTGDAPWAAGYQGFRRLCGAYLNKEDFDSKCACWREVAARKLEVAARRAGHGFGGRGRLVEHFARGRRVPIHGTVLAEILDPWTGGAVPAPHGSQSLARVAITAKRRAARRPGPARQALFCRRRRRVFRWLVQSGRFVVLRLQAPPRNRRAAGRKEEKNGLRQSMKVSQERRLAAAAQSRLG